jgi:hypothetical protein
MLVELNSTAARRCVPPGQHGVLREPWLADGFAVWQRPARPRKWQL